MKLSFGLLSRLPGLYKYTPLCFVAFNPKLPQSFIALRSKGWRQFCLTLSFQGKTRRGGEEQKVEGRESGGRGGEVMTDLFLISLLWGKKCWVEHLSALLISSPTVSSQSLPLLSEISLLVAFMPWQETAIQSLKTQGEMARGDVCVSVYNFVSVWGKARDKESTVKRDGVETKP